MRKIAALHQFIVGLNVVAPEEIDSYVDKIDVTPSGRADDQEPLNRVLSDGKYTATFHISGYPFNSVPVELLIAQIAAWLLEYDDERHETSKFSIIVDVFDESGDVADVANLEFDIIFDERVVATPDAGGDIMLFGQSYSLI